MADNTDDKNVGLVEGMLDFGFKRFITLKFISFVYVLGLLAMSLIGIGVFFGSLFSGQGNILMRLVVGCVAIVVVLIYMVMWRVTLELTVVLFRIGENTSKMVNKQSGTSSAGEAADVS
ncbi:MAG: DUF4282 domain-containing protein [Phycisphaeraceae bacterium]|nr:DUF4282 domain-containing protein [Phycisphaerales bacterium]MCB9861654.1 DUF4282 domain-containing protein [Phycisphaeraceae bacterium]